MAERPPPAITTGQERDALSLFTMADQTMQQNSLEGLFELIAAIFQALLGHGNLNGLLSGSMSNLSGMSFDEMVNHPTFQRSLPEDFRLNHADLNFTTAQDLMADPDSAEAMVDAAVRTAVSIGIEHYAEGAVDRGVDYKFGGKSGNAIDCSGFVKQAIRTAMGGMRDGVTIEASDVDITARFNDKVLNAVNTSSEYQVQNLGREAGILRDNDITMDNMRAGMVIGIDSGDRGWDAGRAMGIDHIGIVYRDTESGTLMFAESASGRDGAHIMPLEDWLDYARDRGFELYGVDVVQLAEVDYEQRAAPTPDAAPETEETMEADASDATADQPAADGMQTTVTADADQTTIADRTPAATLPTPT